uniref:Uncharacterized protein n=1 Tax=Leptocylindrus danicus TaxID=163516 RepID=A0A7S2PMM3_9STRA|mmetsp:Transcript_6540/g.9662  ORF Transcript_6540/g.9662 Transcript_6540/m.9662 type:complete len:120 (+) Transcript_6540:241-600(+)
MPRSPSEFGYEYTVARYRAHVQNPDRRGMLSFSSFRDNLWKDAISNPDLSRFFDECTCAATVSTKGKYYGSFSEEGLLLYIKLCMHISGRLKKCESSDLPGISFLRLLEDLFDHDEDPI